MKLRNKSLLFTGILIAISIIVYANSLQGDFVYDDIHLIEDNQMIRSPGNFKMLFSKDYFDLSRERAYWPVVTAVYFLNYSLGKSNTFVYHLTNLLFHVACTVLVFFLINLLIGNPEAALLGSIVFAVHPLHTESVSYICGKTDLLSTLFFLASFLLYARRKKSRLFYGFSITCFILSLFSKEMSLTLPFILILYDMMINGMSLKDIKQNWLKNYAGHFIVLALFIIGRYTLYKPDTSYASFPGGSWPAALFTMSRVFIKYIALLLVPVNQSIDYVFKPSASILKTGVIPAMILLLGLLYTAARQFRKKTLLSFGILFFFITLIPVSNLIMPIGVTIAERYLYLPSIGFSILIAYFLYSAGRKKIRPVAAAITIGLILFYSYGTISRNRVWNNSIALWEDTVKKSPNNPKAHNYLGLAYFNENMLSDAAWQFRLSIKLDPSNNYAFSNLGAVFASRRMYDEAITIYNEAIRLDPTYVKAVSNLGGAYYMKGMYDDAIRLCKQAIQIDPYYFEARKILAVSYKLSGRYAEAINEYRRLLDYVPDDLPVQQGLEELKKMVKEDK